MDRKEKAIALHDRGYNCAQAVLLAFADDLERRNAVECLKSEIAPEEAACPENGASPEEQACSAAGACSDRREDGGCGCLDKELLFRISEGFGLGMGSMNGTCGALSGAVMLAGLVNSDGNTEQPKTKAATYGLDRELYSYFRERAGASICRDLKGVDTGKMLYSCPDCIRLGVEAAEAVLGKYL